MDHPDLSLPPHKLLPCLVNHSENVTVCHSGPDFIVTKLDGNFHCSSKGLWEVSLVNTEGILFLLLIFTQTTIHIQ